MSHLNYISAKQAVYLILTCILATVDVFLPAEVAKYAGRDAWMSALAAPVIGYLIYLIIVKLCLLFPDLSLAGFNRLLLGRYLGAAVTILYVLTFLALSTSAVMQFSIIMGSAFKPESPPYVWHLVILVPALYVTYKGIAVPARMNELLLPMGLLLLLSVVLLNIPEIDLQEFLPVFYDGYLPPVMGAIIMGSTLGYSMLLLALVPIISKKEKLIQQGPLAFTMVALALLAGTAAIGIFGPILTSMTLFPALQMIRNIDIGFLTRLDALIVTVWYTGFFVFLCAHTFAAASLTRDLFNLRGYRFLMVIYYILVLIGANVYITNVPLTRWLLNVPLAILLYAMALVIPLLLYLVAKLRGYPRQQTK